MAEAESGLLSTVKALIARMLSRPSRPEAVEITTVRLEPEGDADASTTATATTAAATSDEAKPVGGARNLLYWRRRW